MYYNADAGDVIGDEIRIVYTRNGYQGVVQFAEGEPEELVIVGVELSGRKYLVPFQIHPLTPGSSPELWRKKFLGGRIQIQERRR
jgi:hypothetical protein